METDLFKKKMDIAKRAGELNAKINQLSKIIISLIQHKDNEAPIVIALHLGTNRSELYSSDLEGSNGTEMHSALICYLESQIDKRKAELDRLILVLQ